MTRKRKATEPENPLPLQGGGLAGDHDGPNPGTEDHPLTGGATVEASKPDTGGDTDSDSGGGGE